MLVLVLASLVRPTAALAAGASPEEASDAQKQDAQGAFLAGDLAFDQLDYREALSYFRTSHAIVASPNSRLMIARCLLELNRLDEAYDEFAGVVADAGEDEVYRETASTAKQERAALRNRLAWVTIDLANLPEDATIEISGRIRPREELLRPVVLMPGHSVIEARTVDGRVAVANVHVVAARRAEVVLELGKTLTVGELPPATDGLESEVRKESRPTARERQVLRGPAPRASLAPWAYAAGAAGLMGTGAFVAFGLLSESHYRDLERTCTNGSCPPESQASIDDGQKAQLYANVGLALGVAGLATSALLFVLDAKQERRIEVGAGYRSLHVKGTF